MTPLKKLFVLALASSASLACQPSYDGLFMARVAGAGEVLASSVSVPHGQVLVISIEPESSNPVRDYQPYHHVELESFDSSVLWTGLADDIDRFALVGRTPGRVSIAVRIDGKRVGTIDATVTAAREEQRR